MMKLSNISEDYILDYIRGILPERNSYLMEMERYAMENHVPIIEPEVAQLLRALLKMKNSKDILEIGTAIGYSALVMCDAQMGDCRITTIERREDMIDLAKDFIAKSPYESNIHILKGEAEDILSELTDMYDLIFIDAAKGQYLEFFNRCMDLVRPGGLIICDNVLFKGMVATDDLVIRRKKTIVKRLRSFLRYINELEGYTSSIIPIGDGVALSYKEV